MINLKWNRDGAEIVKGMFSKKTISNCLKEIRDVEFKKNKISCYKTLHKPIYYNK